MSGPGVINAATPGAKSWWVVACDSREQAEQVLRDHEAMEALRAEIDFHEPPSGVCACDLCRWTSRRQGGRQ